MAERMTDEEFERHAHLENYNEVVAEAERARREETRLLTLVWMLESSLSAATSPGVVKAINDVAARAEIEAIRREDYRG